MVSIILTRYSQGTWTWWHWIPCDICYSDSINFISIEHCRYNFLTAVTKWMNSWKRNGFKTANGTNVKNRDDIMKLYNLCQKIDVKWVSCSCIERIPKKNSLINTREGSIIVKCSYILDPCSWTCWPWREWESRHISKTRSRTWVLKAMLFCVWISCFFYQCVLSNYVAYEIYII